MRITVTARHSEISPLLKELLLSKVEKLERFGHKLISLHAIFDQEKYFYTAELTLAGKGTTFVARAKDRKDLLTCMEGALMKLKEQLCRRESKLIERNRRVVRKKKNEEKELSF